MPLRLVLDEDAFRKLVAGGIATLRASDGQEVQIILSDIGFDRMLAAIVEQRSRFNADPR